MLHVGGERGRLVRGAYGADWLDRAQDGRADEVLAEVTALLDDDPPPDVRVHALYAQAISLRLLGRPEEAMGVVRALTALCRDLGLAVAGLRARALLAELLRVTGAAGEALEELAHAVAAESGLPDLHDPQVQSALGGLAIALRRSGVVEEGRRVAGRLAAVEAELPLPQRLAYAGDVAVDEAIEALAAARRPPFEPDVAALQEAVAQIRQARAVVEDNARSTPTGADEAAVLGAVLAAVVADPREALDRLDDCRRVLRRGPEAVALRHLWAAGRIRALLRLPRPADALAEGRVLLETIEGDSCGAYRMVLAFEVLRAEEAALGGPASGARACLALAEERTRRDAQRLTALFRARVVTLRSADERRLLARAAWLDSLTGLVNRRGAAAAISAAAGRPDEASLALLLVDLDGFGRVNDLCGHLAGDVVLQRVAAALRVLARSQDVVARWGGDEFVVLAPLEAGEAVALADRIRGAVREGGEASAEEAVTASVGVAVRTGPVPEGEWLRQAELARYTAWRGGGDGTVLATGP